MTAKHSTIWRALGTAVRDRTNGRGVIAPVLKGVRLDSKTCLVTGASSGLGKAVAVALAARGARVLLACRPGHDGLVEEISAASGSDQVVMHEVDLADLDSVSALCANLKEEATRIDIAVFNAGLMPRTARKSAQGFELMFAVHFLANRLLAERMVADGVLAPSADGDARPRLIFVSSEAHRSSPPIDFEQFARFTPYGLKDGLKHYGVSKLHLTTYARALARRLGDDFAVHSLCPGPVNSKMAREAPWFLKPLVSLIMRSFFLTPEKAAEAVLHLACAEDAGTRTGIYLHMMREKAVSPLAEDVANGQQLIEHSDRLLTHYL
ncbi:MAG: SDR family oxidoreductase [Gammaproteobacteria bacterium]|nr:SDR family oxidoreductase [Gammaproteobacteria bacterium]